MFFSAITALSLNITAMVAPIELECHQDQEYGFATSQNYKIRYEDGGLTIIRQYDNTDSLVGETVVTRDMGCEDDGHSVMCVTSILNADTNRHVLFATSMGHVSNTGFYFIYEQDLMLQEDISSIIQSGTCVKNKEIYHE